MQVIYLAALIKGSLEWRCYVSWTSGLTQSDWSIITFCSIYQHLAFDACTRMLTPNSFRCLTSKDNVNLKSKHTHTLTIYNNLRPHVLGGIFTLFENEFRSLICFRFFFLQALHSSSIRYYIGAFVIIINWHTWMNTTKYIFDYNSLIFSHQRYQLIKPPTTNKDGNN